MRASNDARGEDSNTTVPAVPALAKAKRQTTKQTAKLGCTMTPNSFNEHNSLWKLKWPFLLEP